MSSHRAARSGVAVCLLAVFWLAACSDRSAPAAIEPEGIVDATGRLQPLEQRDQVDSDEGNDAQKLSQFEDLNAPSPGDMASSLPRSEIVAGKDRSRSFAAANKPDAHALSELQKKTHQSLNQLANEAFDYLGSRGPLQQVGQARRAKRAGAKGESSADPLEALGRYRESAALPTIAEERIAGFEGGEAGAGGALRALVTPAPSVPELDGEGQTPARSFEQQRRSLEDLAFQPPSGYWANTYVPGDPVMRWLESRLEGRDRSALQAFVATPLLLEAASRQAPQPFDPPSSAAVSLFVQADRRGIEGESRVLLQVGLKGALRHSRQRPAMSVGIVFDVRGDLSTEHARSLRALLDGFLEAKDVGDRFSLTVAGAPGGRLIGPDEFRHGPISLAMARLLEPGSALHPGEQHLDVETAVRDTAAALRRIDDPDAPLGSSMVLLVTSQPLGAHTDGLAALAHESAVAGVPLSVVGIGESISLDEVERVALAGQGNLRLMHAAAEAESVVERELSALSRVIARALRLRIRLAPGVKLVSVIGSEPLDSAGADRVRSAERSVDRRLARNLGIEADRGEDESGIQIVIPTFHSGDSHAVLLDVVASGPGPIADVGVRYKDLVYLRNSIARANLTLGRSAEPPGPLERNVVKNLLGVRLAETLKAAGRELMAGGDERAIASVREFRTLLESVQRELPGFQNDADLREDTRMLGEYLAVLGAGALDQNEPRQYLADSLQLSGYFKTVSRSPAEMQVSRR